MSIFDNVEVILWLVGYFEFVYCENLMDICEFVFVEEISVGVYLLGVEDKNFVL